MGALTNKVKEVQRAAGTGADGDYGPNTIAAVKNYQSAHGLGVDGIAGPQMTAAMKIAREVEEGGSGGPSGGSLNPVQVSGSTRDKIVQDNLTTRSSMSGTIATLMVHAKPGALFASWTWRQAGINFSTAFSGNFYYDGQDLGTLHSGLS